MATKIIDPTPDLSELSLLFEISRILDQSLDLRDVAGPVLQCMHKNTGMMRGTLTLLEQKTGQLVIEAAHGLSTGQRQRGRYLLGEGITGRVVQSGQPVIVPKVSEEPRFLNRTQARQDLNKDEISFICVPIKVDNETIGALSVDHLFETEVSLDEDMRLLSIIASMIAQAVRLRQLARKDRD